ncbi:hypothetical protein N8677_02255, partial [Verrucomicrobia bacterium]|nr:hypothetical protein [Verrucomicrobiota bacterium]
SWHLFETLPNGRSKRRQIGRNELSQTAKIGEKVKLSVVKIGQVQNLPKTEAYPPSRPPSYIDIPTQNFLVILETGL